jgi:hypothetical protein
MEAVMQTRFFSSRGDRNGDLISTAPWVEIQLTTKDLFRLSGDARGTQIASTCGSLWVTQQGDQEDHLLCQGERLTVTRKGTVLVQGISGARVRISPAMPAQ